MDSTYLLLFIIIILVVIGGFFLIIHRFLQSEKEKQNFELRLKYSENLLPSKLQAYERMALFLERIRPSFLIRNISASGNVENYEYLLIETIQKEFEHNLAQQIYIFPKTWEIILSAKNATQLLIKEAARSLDKQSPAENLQQEIIKSSLNEQSSPSTTALLYLQKDIQG